MATNSSSSSPSSDNGKPSRTASAIVARGVPVSGSHDLMIHGYSGTKGLGNGSFITSEGFAIGGRRWRLRYYPDGYNSDYTEWISIILCLDPADVQYTVNAQFMISLLDPDGDPVPSYTKTSQTHTFSRQGGTYGFVHQFIKRKELEESAHLRDDVFGVRCDVTVTKSIFTEPIPAFVVVPPPDMHRHLGQLLSSGDGADVTFEVGAETFRAHRWMLAARSSVFKVELFGPMKEKTDTCVRVDDMEAEVFKAMLHFVYTDSLPGIDEGEKMEMAQHLLVAADRYNLERLKSICEDTLCRYINTSTAATTLVLAEQHGCRGLKDACFEFLASSGNFKAVMAGDGSEHLTRSCPALLKELVANLAT